ncbi:hypothetical protein M513_00114 [Trichuris suis]|uniref:Uncharacterized protein n=1 Tax=Trichuris suis TaxID=68888 RepID=A0A085MP05_9BILA|nr:hypothetical protein M513_00114 [Trichuris suis]
MKIPKPVTRHPVFRNPPFLCLLNSNEKPKVTVAFDSSESSRSLVEEHELELQQQLASKTRKKASPSSLCTWLKKVGIQNILLAGAVFHQKSKEAQTFQIYREPLICGQQMEEYIACRGRAAEQISKKKKKKKKKNQ